MELLESRDFSREFTFSASRSGGPGGQHVNKVNTRVELRFSIIGSDLLNEDEKKLLIHKLGSKLNAEFELVIVSGSTRSQLANKQLCIKKFYAILNKAFTIDKKRIASKPSRASKEKRIEKKKLISKKKELRRPPLKE